MKLIFKWPLRTLSVGVALLATGVQSPEAAAAQRLRKGNTPVRLPSSAQLQSGSQDAYPAELASGDFKFPLLLCVFQYSMVDDSTGKPKLQKFETTEHAFLVNRIDTERAPRSQKPRLARLTGNFEGDYLIPRSNYRIRFDAKIQQSVGGDDIHQLKISSALEYQDDFGWSSRAVGRKTAAGAAMFDQEGRLEKTVFARAANSDSRAYKDESSGRYDKKKLRRALKEGQLNPGYVLNGGVACALMDFKTVAAITSNRETYSDLFASADLFTVAPVREPRGRQVIVALPKIDSVSPADYETTDPATAREREQQIALNKGIDPNANPQMQAQEIEGPAPAPAAASQPAPAQGTPVPPEMIRQSQAADEAQRQAQAYYQAQSNTQIQGEVQAQLAQPTPGDTLAQGSALQSF